MRPALPIDALLPDAIAHLRTGSRLLIRAAPGAGKTTRVPSTLLDARIAGDREVVVLEPRRVAARAAAEFVARERAGRVGGEVGYRVRFEQRGGAETRLWFVTEGVFSRQLASDAFLERVGVVVLDEFHERHLQGDVALAVVKELQETVRPDLKLVVMSATLATESLARHLPDAAVLTSEGRAFPVAIEYADHAIHPRDLAAHVAAAVVRLLPDGDVLVFLPGAAEIRRAAAAIAPLAPGVDVVTLHGDQPLDAQQAALRPGPRRRVVLATNVAETALTVEGVTAVVDSGLARIARLDSRHGLNRLRLATISRASADQRAGRAGRTAPGRCVRLWTRAEDAGRRAHETPEVLRLDLARTVLELRAWGLRDAADLAWLDPPPAAALERAERLLGMLGAVGEGGTITLVGRRMLDLPAEPRVARVLVEAERRRIPSAGALVAALLGERDILAEARGLGGGAVDRPPGPSDVLLRMELFEEARRGARPGVEPRAVQAVERARRQFARVLRASALDRADQDTILRCVLAGYPDRVARRREPGSPRAVMVGGAGVVLAPRSVVRAAELFVALDVEGADTEARVHVASAIERAWLDELFPGAVTTTRALVFDDARERVVGQTRTVFHDLVLAESIRTDVDALAAGTLLADAARADPSRVVDEPALLARLRFLARAMPELELPDANTLLADAVAELCAGRRSFGEVRAADLGGTLRRHLGHRVATTLDAEAPAELRLPSGRVVAIRYEPDRPPVVAARIQELFGLAATPRLAGGRVPLLLEILSPSQRPVQVTDDLASFWRTTYADVRKQLRGRYPKHPWPDDPWTATPTSRAKPRR